MNHPTVAIDYETDATRLPRRHGWIWTLLALPTAVIPFVNFGCDVSPVGAIREAARQWPEGAFTDPDYIAGMLALCLCLGLLAIPWRLRMRLGKSVTLVEGCVVAAIGVAFLVVLTSLFIWHLRAMTKRQDYLSLAAYVFCLGAAAWLAWRSYRIARFDSFALACILGAFISAGAYSLIEFFEDRKLGWWLTLVSVPLSLVELLVLASVVRKQKPPAPTPAVSLSLTP